MRTLSNCSGLQQGVTRSPTRDTASCRPASAFVDETIALPSLICIYHTMTLVVSLLLKNSHAGNEPDNCLTWECLFWCTMATSFCFGHLFFFILFLSPYAVEHHSCATVVEINWSERYTGEVGERKSWSE